MIVFKVFLFDLEPTGNPVPGWNNNWFIFLTDICWFQVLEKMARGIQTRKTAAIRRIAVRETGVFQLHGRQIEGPHETTRTSEHYHIEGYKGVH